MVPYCIYILKRTMDKIEQIRSSEAYEKVFLLQSQLENPTEIPKELDTSIASQARYKLTTNRLVHIRPEELQVSDDKDIYKQFMADGIDATLVTTLIQISGIFNSQEGNEFHFNGEDTASTQLQEYLASKTAWVSESSLLSYEKLIKRQIFICELRNHNGNPHELVNNRLKSYIQYMGFDEDGILFYPIETSHCIFDYICRKTDLTEKFIEVFGIDKFIRYLTSNKIIQNNVYDHTIPLVKYMHMMNKFGGTQSAIQQTWGTMMDHLLSKIDDDHKIESAELTDIDKTVLLNYISSMSAKDIKDKEILKKLSPWIDETVVVRLLNSPPSLKDTIEMAVGIIDTGFDISEMLYSLNVTVKYSQDISTIKELMEDPKCKELLMRVKKDPISLVFSLDDKNNDHLLDVLIREFDDEDSDEKTIKHYITFDTEAGEIRLKRLDMFTSLVSTQAYIKSIIDADDKDGIEILMESMSDLVTRYSDKGYLTEMGLTSKYLEYCMNIGIVLCRYDKKTEYVDSLLANDIFSFGIVTMITDPGCYDELISSLYPKRDLLSDRSIFTLHLIKNKCEKSYEPGECAYFDEMNKDDSDAAVAAKFITLTEGEPETTEETYRAVGRFMFPLYMEYISSHQYDTFLSVLPHVNDTIKDHFKKTGPLHYFTTARAWHSGMGTTEPLGDVCWLKAAIENDVITTEDYQKFSDVKSYSRASDMYFDLTIPDEIDVTPNYKKMFDFVAQKLLRRSNNQTPINDMWRFCVKRLTDKLDASVIADTVVGNSNGVTSTARYCNIVSSHDNKEKVNEVYMNLMGNTHESNYAVPFNSRGPFKKINDYTTEEIDQLFTLTDKTQEQQEIIDRVINNYVKKVNAGFTISTDRAQITKVFTSSEFCARLANYMMVMFTNDPNSIIQTYRLLYQNITYRPEYLGRSGIFHKGYWTHLQTNGHAVINSFLQGMINYYGFNSNNNDYIIKSLKFLNTYVETSGKPCEYSVVSTSISALFKKHVNNSDITSGTIDLVEKFDGLYAFITTGDVMELMFKNISICKTLMGKLSHEQQKDILETNADGITFIMESDFAYYLDLADKFGLSADLDITNRKIIYGLKLIDPDRVYALHKNGYIKCNIWDLVVKIPELIDNTEIELTDKIIDTVFGEDDCNEMMVRILNRLYSAEDKTQYNEKFNKIVANYIETDPFSLSDFLGQVKFSSSELLRKEDEEDPDSICSKMYKICKYDPSLYNVMFMSDMSNERLINMQMLSGDLMLSYFKDNVKMMKAGIPYIEFDILFSKNRSGKFVIETILTDNNKALLERRQDGEEIIKGIEKHNICGYITLDGIEGLLENSKTASNKFMLMCMTLSSDKIMEVIESLSKKDINKLMVSLDDKLNNGLFYIVRYHSDILDAIIEQVDDVAFFNSNAFGETLAMYAMRYNHQSYDILEDSGKITEEQNYVNISTGSLISYTVKYNGDKFKHIIESPYFNEYSIYVKDTVDMIDFGSENFVRVKCLVNLTNIIVAYGNSDSFLLFKKMFPSVFSRHINELFDIVGDDFYTLKYAFLVEPDLAQIIVGSDVCTATVLDKFQKSFPGGDFSCISQIQPASWRIINRSDKFADIKPPQQDTYHYGKKTNMGYIVEHATESQDRLIRYKQSFNFTDRTSCKICETAKATILHSSCGHRLCVCCSLIEKKCPFCNTNTPQENQYYID